MTFIGVILAYLIGSIPTSVWIGRLLFGIDIRHYGSGNAGATNTFRILGIAPGIVVMIIDTLKGFLAASLVLLLVKFGFISETPSTIVYYKLVFGVVAVIGHIFPVYVNFKGGKGVATLLGMVLAIHLEASLVCMAVFLVVMLISKYVSLGSILAALTFPLLFFFPHFKTGNPTLIIFGFCVFAIIILTHQKNIVRIVKGEEKKVNFRKRKRKAGEGLQE